MSESTSPKEAIRAKLFAAKPRSSVRVTYDGTEFELRNPTLSERRSFAKESGGDGTTYNLLACIACTFIPGTDERVFSPHDKEALLQCETGGMVDVLSVHLAKLMQTASVEAEEAAKK